jgi:hypothetical protein
MCTLPLWLARTGSEEGLQWRTRKQGPTAGGGVRKGELSRVLPVGPVVEVEARVPELNLPRPAFIGQREFVCPSALAHTYQSVQDKSGHTSAEGKLELSAAGGVGKKARPHYPVRSGLSVRKTPLDFQAPKRAATGRE